MRALSGGQQEAVSKGGLSPEISTVGPQNQTRMQQNTPASRTRAPKAKKGRASATNQMVEIYTAHAMTDSPKYECEHRENWHFMTEGVPDDE